MPAIHPSAIVDPGAKLGSNVKIGAFSVIGPHVTLGDDCMLHSHVVVEGHTTIGHGCQIFPFASIGHNPQDISFKGEESRLEIGENTVIREYVTINPGTERGGMVTKVGKNCFLMAHSHIAHDCAVGDHVIMANGATLGGHCVIGDHVILGGLSACHQFVRIGEYAFVGGMSGVEHDVIPYGMIFGSRATLKGLNLVGLKRQGLSREEVRKLRKAYDVLFGEEGTLMERAEKVARQFPEEGLVARMIGFVRDDSSRSISVPKAPPG